MPTHSADPEDTGLLPHVTVRQAFKNAAKQPSSVYGRAALKAIEELDQEKRGSGEVLCQTVVATQNPMHPNGKGRYNTDQSKILQGFEEDHRISSTDTTRQIGNAMSPVFGVPLFTSIRDHLRKVDRMRKGRFKSIASKG